MHEPSLPLFDEASLPDSATRSRRQRRGTRRFDERHLHAARRLSREMRRVPEGSPEQTRAGRRICRHLIAMLQGDAERRDRSGGQRGGNRGSGGATL